MKHPLLKYYLSLIIIFSGCISAVSAQGSVPDDSNPLIGLVGKPYSEYHDVVVHIVDSLLYTDSLSRAELIRLFREAAEADKSGEWNINYCNVVYHLRFYKSREGGYVAGQEYTAEQFAGDLTALAEEAGKRGFGLLRIRALFDVGETYRIYLKDYEQAFHYYLEAADVMDGISTKEFPLRTIIYRELAGLYYTFREYGDAAHYYRKLLDDPDTRENTHSMHFPALNELGLCYRYGEGDYNRSDSCFVRLVEWTRPLPELWRDTWEGIAKANIGYNYYLRNEPDTALSYLVPALDKMTRPNDYPFRSRCAADIAAIYLDKRQPVAAKKYLDLALDYHEGSRVPKKDSRLYQVLFDYYAQTGDQRKAIAYHDSTLVAQTRESDAFSGLVLRRVEQQLRAADNRIHEQELDAEKIRGRFYMHMAFIVSGALVIILAMLGLTLFFYRRKRNAYRELVRRGQSWAGVEISVEPLSDDNNGHKEHETVTDDKEEIVAMPTAVPEEGDRVIMESIEKVMAEKKLYKRSELSLDMLATETGLNRYYVSQALNRCTGKNFSTYVNEYRIKEAIRIMSEPGNDNLTIDAVAFEAGFNDRISFYRIFKKITGLSPTDFRKNMNGK